jgi:hypothetical protein
MMMNRFLRAALMADAAATAATGVLLVAASQLLETWLGLPSALLFYAGAALLPYAALVFYLGSRTVVARTVVWAVVGCNAVWAVASVGLLLSGWVAPSGLGYAFVLGQAVVVAGFCELQVAGLRRMGGVAAAQRARPDPALRGPGATRTT